MRFRLVMLILFTLFLQIPDGSVAQNDTVTWRYAWNQDSGALVAYDLDGNTQTLISEGIASWRPLARFQNDIALAFLELDDGEEYLYRLAPDSAQLIAGVDSDHKRIRGWHGSTIILQSVALNFNDTTLLVNAETASVEQLTGFQNGVSPCCAFSADGQYLRYLSHDAEESLGWTLWERDLSSGEERVIYHLEMEDARDSLIIQPDAFGDRWLLTTFSDTIITLSMVYQDARIEVYGEYDPSDRQLWGFFGTALYTYDFDCESDCSVAVHPSDGDASITYRLMDEPGHTILVSYVDANRLLVVEGYANFWLLSSDAPALCLGAYSPEQIFLSEDLLLSPDGRHLTVLDDEDAPQSYRVWDLEAGQIIWESAFERVTFLSSVIYGNAGQILWFVSGPSDVYIMLPYADDAVPVDLPVPDEERWQYFEVLPDGTILFNKRIRYPALGIFRYDVTTGEDSPVLEGGWEPIVFRPMPRQ